MKMKMRYAGKNLVNDARQNIAPAVMYLPSNMSTSVRSMNIMETLSKVACAADEYITMGHTNHSPRASAALPSL